MKLLKSTLWLSMVPLAIGDVSAAGVTLASFDRHELQVQLDVPTPSARIVDAGEVTLTSGWNLFYLNGTAVIDSFLIDGVTAEYVDVAIGDTSSLPPYLREELPELETENAPRLVFIHADRTGRVDLHLSFRAEFTDDVANTRFSNEMVGREVHGTILEQGAYLSSSSYYYPQGAEEPFMASVAIDLPAHWTGISDGNLLSDEMAGDRRRMTWSNPFRSDGFTIMAAPFVVRSRWVDSVEVACYFFAEDTSLIEDYLTATVDYLKMYSELIGPYPYERFTVVENFFPTGYGMPAWTLLGQRVIRLPFIIGTSLGHEVLHNWWGNSVYVDYERGNWCEAASVYGADYRYKLLRSPDEARDYRKDILKQYVSYVDEGNDFPIREFTSRTSPGTRTIGYNKAMMVYHMIEEMIGTEAFFEAWKRIYAEHLGSYISWEEWIGALEQSRGHDLAFVIPQWIDRAGAPVLGLEVEGSSPGPLDKEKEVSFRLTQASGDVYRLKVPVRFSGAEEVLDTTVWLHGAESLYVVRVAGDVHHVAVDPDYHLFRLLYPEEIEPIVSAVMGTDSKVLIAEASDEETAELYKEFGLNMTGDSLSIHTERATASPDTTLIVLNPAAMPAYLAARIDLGEDSLTLGGTTFARAGHTFVFTVQEPTTNAKYMVILSDDLSSLPRIGQLVPHYGKYSYLVFEGARNVGKGQWDAGASPLAQGL